MRTLTRAGTITAGLLIATSALAACSTPSESGGTKDGSAGEPSLAELTTIPQVKADEKLAAQLPAATQEAGSLTVATAGNLPPMSYVAPDDKTLIGLDIDMSRAIAATLGLEADIKVAGFDTIIPGLSAGRYDAALSSIGVTLERQEVVDFVSYYNGGQGFLASSDSDFTVTTLEDICGLDVAIQNGSSQQLILEEEDSTCEDAGLEPWRVQTFPGTNEAVLSIAGGRTDVMYASISVVDYTAAQNPDYRVAGRYSRAIVGAALPKDSGLAAPIEGAIQELMDNGTYAEILEKWGLEDNAIDEPEINGATS